MKGAYVIIPKLRPTLERPQIDEMRLGLQVLKIREVLEIGDLAEHAQDCKRNAIANASTNTIIEMMQLVHVQQRAEHTSEPRQLTVT
jgi:hypothetical protein